MNNRTSSNLDYVYDMMDNLQGKIASANSFVETKHDVESVDKTSKLYDKTNQIMKAYADAQGELLNKLNHEAESIRIVAKKYYALDQHLKEGAKQI